MAQVYVSIGSNIDRQRNIQAGLDALAERFGRLALSSVYESEAVGFEGDNFYNLVASFHTEIPVGELADILRAIETANGRQRQGPKFSARTLDIDILAYDDKLGTVDGIDLPREEILDNAFVLLPLAELAPGARHPATGKSYQQLWDAYDQNKQRLWSVDFRWRGQSISRASE